MFGICMYLFELITIEGIDFFESLVTSVGFGLRLLVNLRHQYNYDKLTLINNPKILFNFNIYHCYEIICLDDIHIS